MKLYYSKGAASLAIRIMMIELDLACAYEAVDLQTKITESGGNYLEVTSKGYVPALQIDDNTVLTETAAILVYLADQHEAMALLPSVGDMNRYRVLEWLNFIGAELHKSCAMLINPDIPRITKARMFSTGLKIKLNLLNDHFAQNSYLVDNQFTIADGYLVNVIFWLPEFLKINLSPWPHLMNYLLNLKNRPSIQKAFHEEKFEAVVEFA